MLGRTKLLWGWWLLVLVGFGTYSVVTLRDLNSTSPAVIRVISTDGELWALTYEQIFLQGGDSVWWVSTDGGTDWSAGDPPLAVIESDSVEESCGDASCFRLVDGARIEARPVDSPTWRLEHERPPENAPPANHEARSDWEAERSLAVAIGPRSDAVAVAAGSEGTLVRDTNGAWQTVSVGRSWFYGIRWWLIAFSGAAALVGGLVVDQIIRHVRPLPPAATLQVRKQ